MKRKQRHVVVARVCHAKRVVLREEKITFGMRVSPVIYHLPLQSWPAPLVDDEERLACALVQLQTMVGHAYGQSNGSLLWYTILYILPEPLRLNKEGYDTLSESGRGRIRGR